ncbi:putative COF1-cofilin [Boletus edulis BED1]|uniref:Cofilin n=1 Tax=Boletus edulis BED1 TaxID=1328754 RepID=A0AAD4BTS7_BOLED|nr:putative COF1-cofilin [Boletus edulis BED1]
MASGIQITDECLTTFQELKLGRKFKYILFTLSEDLSKVVVEKTSDVSDYDAFPRDLPKDQCRWAVYDFDFERDGSKRNKLCFVSWSPDDAKIKNKMVFASSHESLKQMLDGIAFEVQATDPSEISYATVLVKALTSTH